MTLYTVPARVAQGQQKRADKLQAEVDRLRAEIVGLRRENQELRDEKAGLGSERKLERLRFEQLAAKLERGSDDHIDAARRIRAALENR